ncbi:MAG: pilus assembly protein N-terminal domain-containing protein [Leptolyngbya sp.]|nr:pilus assembly protein N-terminal domain-containing protein [Candidatus Melainabacteria bacterium]
MSKRALLALCCFAQTLCFFTSPFSVKAEGAAANNTDAKPVAREISKSAEAPVEIREVQKSMQLDITAARSRCFRTKKKLLRVSVSDPTVADVAVVSEHEFIVNGKAPGAISLLIWCEK